MVECPPGYVANHCCSKGHVILCLRGKLDIELEDGRQLVLHEGQTYHVGDGDPPHRSATLTGAKLFIVDWSLTKTAASEAFIKCGKGSGPRRAQQKQTKQK